MRKAQTSDELLPLTPAVFHILVALSEGERHGYAIMRQVAEDTDGSLQLGPGTLYGCLKRMLSATLIEESDERPDPTLDDERRAVLREALRERLGAQPGRAIPLTARAWTVRGSV